MRITARDVERFNAKITPSGDCHVFAGYSHPSGHAAVWMDGAMRLAHRVAWTIAHGQIPDGLCVCHRCDNPPCVRVDHLFLGTVADNNADRDTKRRGRLPAPDQIRRPTAGPVKHGTITGYIKRKCRCDECREAKRIYDSDARCDACGTSLTRSNLARHRRLVHGLHLLGADDRSTLPQAHLEALTHLELPEEP